MAPYFADDTAEGWENTYARLRRNGYSDEDIDFMVDDQD